MPFGRRVDGASLSPVDGGRWDGRAGFWVYAAHWHSQTGCVTWVNPRRDEMQQSDWNEAAQRAGLLLDCRAQPPASRN